MDQGSISGRTLAVGDVHSIDLPIRWGDADMLAHLNNTVYFRLMEEARIRIMYDAGLPVPSDHNIILAHASCDFLQSIHYPADVRVTHRVVRIGRSSMEFDMLLSRPEDAASVYARGRNVLVWVASANNKSAPWPPEVLAAVGAQFRPAG